jgi:hypothetical protein
MNAVHILEQFSYIVLYHAVEVGLGGGPGSCYY